MLLPPKEMKGRGMPITGIIPMVIPIFTNQWKNRIQATEYPKTRPNVSV